MTRTDWRWDDDRDDVEMIDLHVHLLPDIDDGAHDLSESRAMLTRFAAMGFTRVVATPHLMEPLSAEYALRVDAALDATRGVAADFSIQVDLGYEVMLTPGVAARLAAGEASTLAGSRSILVELPFAGWPQHAESSLFALQMAGYVPVLAHPERYVDVQKDPELALAVAARGVVLQLTEASFAGAYGKGVQRSAQELLIEGLMRRIPMVLSSDAHSDGKRLTSVPDGLRWIQGHVADGADVIRWMTETVPAALLDGAEIPALAAMTDGALSPAGRPSLWRRVTGRG